MEFNASLGTITKTSFQNRTIKQTKTHQGDTDSAVQTLACPGLPFRATVNFLLAGLFRDLRRDPEATQAPRSHIALGAEGRCAVTSRPRLPGSAFSLPGFRPSLRTWLKAGTL